MHSGNPQSSRRRKTDRETEPERQTEIGIKKVGRQRVSRQPRADRKTERGADRLGD